MFVKLLKPNNIIMKTKTITYLLLFGIIFYGCSKCEETTGRTEILDPSDIPILFPYNDGAKIKFLRNKIDTVIFYYLGLQTKYNYTSTQSDCPVKIPLEQKHAKFIDSVFGNSFNLINYRTPTSNFYFDIIINNKIVAYGPVLGYAPTQPLQSTTILGKKYDTVSVWNNYHGDSVIFKTINYGVLKFYTNGNTFELIP